MRWRLAGALRSAQEVGVRGRGSPGGVGAQQEPSLRPVESWQGSHVWPNSIRRRWGAHGFARAAELYW